MAKARRKTIESGSVGTASLDPIDSSDARMQDDTNTIAPRGAGDTTAAAVDRERIASRAYELYVNRGRQEGRALDDWLEAEQELLQLTGARRDRE
jgi:hypothetical protein